VKRLSCRNAKLLAELIGEAAVVRLNKIEHSATTHDE